MKSSIWLFIAMCSLISCTKIYEQLNVVQPQNRKVRPDFTEYTIRKGNHYSEGNTFKQLQQTELRCEVVFDSSAIYTTAKSENQYDINKLYGFSDCGTMHHENSARFGWRWNGKSIEIHAYWYNDSIRMNKFVDTVSIGTTTEIAIKVLPAQYMFEIKQKTFLVPRHCSSETIQGYRLYPYFGGDETAPHDISIKMREL